MPRDERRKTRAKSETQPAPDPARAPQVSGTDLFDVALSIANKNALTIDVAIDLIATHVCIAGGDREALLHWMRDSLSGDPSHGQNGTLFVARDKSAAMARGERTLRSLMELESSLADAQFIEVLKSQGRLEVKADEMRADLAHRLVERLVGRKN